MINENIYLQNVHRIISECSDDKNIKNLSLNELQPMYLDIANHIFRISVSNTCTFKNMLWNLDNLKSEIRSRFQKEFFDKWYSAYEQSIQIDFPENHQDKEQVNFIGITENELITEPARHDYAPATEHSDKRQEKEPIQEKELVETVSDTKSSILTGQVYKRDWFDKFFDVVSSVMGYFLGLMSR